MKKILIFTFCILSTSHSIEMDSYHGQELKKFPLIIEITNDSYLAHDHDYLQYSRDGKIPIPTIGTSLILSLEWSGFTYKSRHRNAYIKSGWFDCDGNWWRPSGSLYFWNDLSDFKKNGKIGHCLLTPGLNYNVLSGNRIDKKEFNRKYNKVVVHLISGSYCQLKVILEFLRV